MTDETRRIKGRTATFLVVASMVGTGVFTSSGLLLEQLSSTPAVLLAWGIGGLLAMTGALSYAELVAALPRNGGEYQLLSEVYHPAIGFSSGVVSFVVGFSAPVAASAIAFGDYLHAAWPAIPETPAALGLIASMCLLHGFRVGVGSGAQDALTAFKLLLVAGFVVAGLGSLDLDRLGHATRPLLDASLSPAFAVALIYVTFSYSGWNAATYVAGELERPERALPIALILGTTVVTALYLAVNVVFLAGAPPEALRGVVEVGSVAVAHMHGPAAARVLSAIIALGLVSTVGALIMTGTRVLDAMGRDHGPLAALARRASGGGPFVAVALQGVLATVMVLTSSFGALLGYIGFTLSIFAALTVAGVLVLRRRRPELARPYRTWGYPITPIVFVALMLWMIVWSIAAEPAVALVGAGTIALGLALWAAVRRG